MDNQTVVTNQRPVSLNMELVTTTETRLPPPYDESNEMAEKLSEDQDGDEVFTDTQSSRRSLASTQHQPSLVNLPRPISIEVGGGSTDDVRSEIVSLCTAPETDRRSLSLSKSDSYDSASSQPFQPTHAGSSIELGSNIQNTTSFPRQQSCIEFRQLERNERIEERREGDGSEGDSSRSTPLEQRSISRQSSPVTRYTPSTLSGSQTYPRTSADMRVNIRGEKAPSEASSTLDKSTLGVNHKHATFPRRKRARKKVLMKPPTLKTLHSKRYKLIDSTLAIRLATYDKMIGSSREDLASVLPEFSCGENTKLLNDIAMKGFDPRPPPPLPLPPPPPEMEQSHERVKRRGTGKRRKTKGRRSTMGDDELGTIYEGSESDAGEERRDLEVTDIPMWPVLLLLFGYITSGAIFFFLVEKHWNFFDAFYFCFITLTTIGFGDLVPESSLVGLISCCVYTMIGMAVTSMCIALIMKKFVFIVKNFGRRIGIIRD